MRNLPMPSRLAQRARLARLAILSLCAGLLLANVQLALAALPSSTRQTIDPAPVQPDADAALSRRVFLPAIARGPVARVSAIELTQATQNAAQSVPMVAGRPTVARVFLQSNAALAGLTITLSAARAGVALPGSPLRRTGATAFKSPNRLRASDSTNFILPASWLSGSVVLTARVVEGGESPVRSVTFQPVAPLRITVVPIRYIHAPTGKTYAAPTSVAFPASVQRMFPVPNLDVRMRAAVTYRGNLTAGANDRLASWEELLDLMLSLKHSDGAASDVIYVGVLPSTIANDNRIYFSGVGTSLRATVNFDMQLTPAHELGHALGRAHAPCGGASGVDPAYPYPGALIGALGFNTSDAALLDPAVTTDLMSYCSEWISDYNYMGMYQNQRAAMAAAVSADTNGVIAFPEQGPIADGILVRAQLSPGRAAALLPLYAMRAPLTTDGPQTMTGAHVTVAFVDGGDATLAEHTVQVAEAEEDGLTIRVLNAMLPVPQGNAVAVELRAGESMIARRELHANAPPSAPVVATDTDALHVTLPAGAPHLVRLVQGGRITTLALDDEESELNLPIAELPGGPGIIEVIPADTLPAAGVAAAALAVPLNLEDAPPTAWMSPPETPAGGGGIVIAGYAVDPEDGMLTNEWFLNDLPAVQGPFLQIEQVEALPPHTVVQLRASDSAGHSVSATVTLQSVQSSPTAP